MSDYMPADAYDEDGNPYDAATEAELQFNRMVRAEVEHIKVRETARERVRREKDAGTPWPVPQRLGEFLTRRMDPVTHRIDGLWPAGGRVLLSAQFKSGKTTLRDNAVRALVDGVPFLGRFDVHPFAGAVVVLDFELDERTLQRWLGVQEFEHPERVHVLAMKGRASTFDILDKGTRARWATMLRELGAAVIAIDCVRPILDALGLSEDHDGGRFLEAVDALTVEAGAAEVLVVHHMGHNGERSRGDSRFRDWPDAEWKLVRDKDDGDPTAEDVHGARYFSAFGRDVAEPECALTFDPDTHHLSIGGGSRKDTKARACIPAIIEALADKGELSGRGVEAELKDTEHGQKDIRAALKLAIAEGIVRVEAGPNRSKIHSLNASSASVRHGASAVRQRTVSECVSASIGDALTDHPPGIPSASPVQCVRCGQELTYDDGTHTHPTCAAEAAS